MGTCIWLRRALKHPSEELKRSEGAGLLRTGGIVQVHVSCPFGSESTFEELKFKMSDVPN